MVETTKQSLERGRARCTSRARSRQRTARYARPSSPVTRTKRDALITASWPFSNEVSAIDPVASMQGIPNAALKAVASEVRQMLREVIAAV